MHLLRLRDFDLELGPTGADGLYPVAVLNSPSGQARASMRFPWGPTEMAARLGALEDAVLGGAADPQAQALGSLLFDALLTGEVRTVFDRSRQAVADSGEGLRIRLRVNAPDLAAVPWEFLFDPRAAEFLALSRLTPIVRYLELPLGEQTLAVKPPLRILAMVAGPTDAPPLDVTREKARLEQALQSLKAKGQVELVWLEDQTWRGLQAAMQAGPWHVFHFVGHAAFNSRSDEGVLLLAGDDGRATTVSASQLAGLLADHRTLRLTVLNACEGAKGSEQSRFSSIAAGLVRRGLPAVLAMQYEISDRAAIEFTASFYSALAAGLPIDAATSEARKAIDLALAGSLEWGTPLLIMRTPDGVLWDVQARRKLPLAAVLGTGAVLVAVLALLLWVAAGQARLARVVNQPTATPAATPTPAQMGGTFNIAVANFGQLDPASGQVSESEEGRLLSQWLAQNLADELRRTGDEDLPGRVEVWHDAVESPNKNVQFGTLTGDSAEARQAAAAALAETVRANLVVFGSVLGSGPDAELTIEFYLAPSLSKDEFGDVVGVQRLGRPVQGPFDPSNPLDAEAVEEQMSWRGRALYWLTLGLVQQLRGRPEQALAIFDRAEQALQDWPERDGKEILYFFQGREHFFLAQELDGAASAQELDDAQRLFQQALDLRPDYARARAALGSVHRHRAQAITDPAARLADANLQAALDQHERALQDAQAAGDPLVEAVVGAALAKSYRLLGATYYELGQHEEAGLWLDQAVTLASDAGAVLAENGVTRVLAQTYETQGAARLAQYDILRSAGDLPGARERVSQAQAAFESCVAQSENARRDEILLEQIIGAAPDGEDVDEVLRGCQRLLGLAQQIAQELGEVEP